MPFVRDRLVATVAKIPPVPQFLASMVAGTVIDPFKRIGLTEVQWDFGQNPGHDRTSS